MGKLKCSAILFTLMFSLLCACHHQPKQYHGSELVRIKGTIFHIPDNATVELVLLALNSENSPRKLLNSEMYQSNGQNIAFEFLFDLDELRGFPALELRGRVSCGKQLLGYLPFWHNPLVNRSNNEHIVLDFAVQSDCNLKG